jgi:Uma2 family endonuclease
MHEYLESGAQLGWLIDPQHRSVAIYRKDAEVETRTDIRSIAGEGPVAGFELDLALVWNPFGE